MKEFKIRVPNTQDFVLESNKIYYIQDKEDPQAPKEFREKGINKFPFPDVDENIAVPCDTTRGVWDTCFYDSSPSLSSFSEEEKQEFMKVMEEDFIPELKNFLPEEAFDNKIRKGENYWDYFTGFKLKSKISVSTNEPLNMLALFFGIISYAICPETEKKSPKFREAGTKFLIIDKKQVAEVSQSRDYTRTKAQSFFLSMAEGTSTEKSFLQDLLNYNGVRFNVEKSEPAILNSQFKKWTSIGENSFHNAKSFVESYDYFKTDDGKEEMAVYKKLLLAQKTKKLIIERDDFILEGNNLGSNLKQAAKTVNGSSPLKTKLFEVTSS